MGAKMSAVAPEEIAARVKDAEESGGILDLHQCSLDEECARQLSLVLEASTIHRAVLSSNQIGDAGAVHIGPSLRDNLKLHRLVLMGNGIGDTGVAALVDGLLPNRHLRHLDLHDNNITEAGGYSLARLLRYTHHLEDLLVGSNAIGDKGVRAMSAAIKKNHRGKIHTLGLSSNKLTDPTAERLWHLVNKFEHTITKIDLGNNDINDPRNLELIKTACRKNKKFTTLKAWEHDAHQKKRRNASGAASPRLGKGTVDDLTVEQKKNINDAFVMYDRDGNGSIEASELAAVLKECHHGEEPDPELLKEMMANADEDGSGLIEKAEFMRLMARQIAGSDSESESSSSEEDDDSDEEVLKGLDLWEKNPNGVPEGRPPSPAASMASADQAEIADIDALADLDDLEALDLDTADDGATATPNPLAKAPTKEELAALAAQAVPVTKGSAKKAVSDAESGLDAQRERAKARIAAAKLKKQEQAAGQPKGGRQRAAPAPAPAPVPGADPAVARNMATLE